MIPDRDICTDPTKNEKGSDNEDLDFKRKGRLLILLLIKREFLVLALIDDIVIVQEF